MEVKDILVKEKHLGQRKDAHDKKQKKFEGHAEKEAKISEEEHELENAFVILQA